MHSHAFVIEAPTEEGIELALSWVERELGMRAQGNPDVIVLSPGLLSVEDARKVGELASGAPFVGEHKVIVIAASRAYHEAQNALLKVFEEPPQGTHLFLVFPTLGGLLPTLRSRVQVMVRSTEQRSEPHELAREFMAGSREKRAAVAKKLATGKDDEDRRAHRDEAIELLNGIEAVASADVLRNKALLGDIATLRGHLYDRSAPVKMILEHLALVTPKDLV